MNSMFDTLKDMKNGKVAVVGLGLSGISTVDYLLRNGISPDLFDSRITPPNKDAIEEKYKSLKQSFGVFSDNEFLDYTYVIVSPGITLKTPALANALRHNENVFCDVELFARINTKPVLAITGSNGKSTAVGWLEHALNGLGIKAAACGNYGVPVLDVIDKDVDVFVIELSSFQLESVQSLECAAAVVLNVSEDHMDRYDSFEDYSKAKNKIYRHADLCIYNQDDFQTKPLISHDNVVSFGSFDECCEQTCWQYDVINKLLLKNGREIACLDDFNISGNHNGLNGLVVLAMAQAIGVDVELDSTLAVFKSFAGLPHRCQLALDANGVRYIDDSKATNVASTLAALNGLANDKNIILIAGGDAKGADLAELADAIDRDVKFVVALGKDKQQFESFVPAEKLSIVDDLKQAVEQAGKVSVSGDCVLLSPACASIDMFKNYQQRGLMFQSLVKELRQ
ncbi:UDP-N-acetylmuramoyl-L-alanine--D-glutamate ligase [Psychrosphaera sp. B3R10]|uniref:UDP-N-acetylmuramoyl-L-alanine--D-glutamate ligase n=1 Tax=unclassified Psychrosphaera TaxID=2641570 RepID=UPI001C0A5EAA|nr:MULTISPECIES: UDP-N-acetylmuramoyl-L-alanine--D-glutamate ligase [unclassified Psychrosphaera]MBU2880458.1 UDP-N-acetylmuramoyl-L-alanine--D-glutamate ligase [Psychrosphaera sp. I2R16]MBU2991441.1 UDP-N-acetylmuramoyl-L-alanine--D-glutamate ligase [Psychrosphaera sp. B3R10]MDO6720322.1 UDP-N-acetylmuramoyl-L-alanine--D-glutamate ligase [Psychrosphaera sp. 1_MG-2023]